MEPEVHYRAMLGICRQRAKMEGENEAFWLAEAEVLEMLAINAQRQGILASKTVERRKDLAG